MMTFDEMETVVENQRYIVFCKTKSGFRKDDL